MKKDLESVEWKSLNFSKNCIVMGEFGAFKVPVVFPTPEAAAFAMKINKLNHVIYIISPAGCSGRLIRLNSHFCGI